MQGRAQTAAEQRFESNQSGIETIECFPSSKASQVGLNRTKVELKRGICNHSHVALFRLNRTKVELKLGGKATSDRKSICLNRTKVELKPASMNWNMMSFEMFESNQSGIETLQKPKDNRTQHQFESNQSGIETRSRDCAPPVPPCLNRTKVELKPDLHRQMIEAVLV